MPTSTIAGVSRLLNVMALDLGQDSTTIEYSAPSRFPEGNSGAASSDHIPNDQADWSPKDALLLERAINQRAISCSTGRKTKGLKERDVEPHHAVEKENRFLKARVEELEAENVKVGHVISDLRRELETAGVLQRLKGFPANVENHHLEKDKVTHSVTEDTYMPSLHQHSTRPDSAWIQQPKRPSVFSTPEQEALSLAEREELQALRSMMKDGHDRTALFYKLVDSIEEKPLHKSVGKTCVTFDQGDLHEDESEPNRKSPNHHKSIPNSSEAGISHGPTKGQGAPCENHGALTVSAEVLKLNEQIARVRQQLTTLCSTDQTDPSPSPGSEGKSYSRSRSSPRQPLQLDSYDASKSQNLSPKKQRMIGGRSTSSTHYHETCEQERAPAKLSKEQNSPRARRKRVLNWADMGGALLGKSALKQDREVCFSQDYPFTTRKEKPESRPSARDSLGASRFRTNVSKKLKVRVPSVASSQSDIVCTHCRRHVSDEENDNTLHDSTPEMSHHPSPKVQANRSHCIREPKHWERFTNGCMDSSTASEEREEAHHSSHNCRKKLKRHGIPALAGWSDESDESRPHGSSLPRQGAAVPSVHSNSHLASSKPWSRPRDRRGPLQQAKGLQRPQVVKDESHLRKGSGPTLRKKGSVVANSKVVRKEKAFPANLRENVHSHQPGFIPQKLSL